MTEQSSARNQTTRQPKGSFVVLQSPVALNNSRHRRLSALETPQSEDHLVFSWHSFSHEEERGQHLLGEKQEMWEDIGSAHVHAEKAWKEALVLRYAEKSHSRPRGGVLHAGRIELGEKSVCLAQYEDSPPLHQMSQIVRTDQDTDVRGNHEEGNHTIPIPEGAEEGHHA